MSVNKSVIQKDNIQVATHASASMTKSNVLMPPSMLSQIMSRSIPTVVSAQSIGASFKAPQQKEINEGIVLVEPKTHPEFPKFLAKQYLPISSTDAAKFVVDETPQKPFKEVYHLDSSAQVKWGTVFDEDVPRVDLCVRRTKALDIVKGMCSTKLFKAVVVSTAFTLAAVFGVPTLIAALVGLSVLLAATPPGWIILGAAVAGFAIGYLIGHLLSNKGTADKTEAQEVEIFDKNDFTNTGRLYIGSFPSRFYNDGEELANKKHVGVVISANKPSDRERVGTRLPYRDKDWADLGISHCPLNVDDRELLTQEQLELGAQIINAHLSAGEGVDVTGQAGKQAIMAYLLKYYPTRTVDEAMEMAGETRSDVRKEIEQYNQHIKESSLYG